MGRGMRGLLTGLRKGRLLVEMRKGVNELCFGVVKRAL